MISATQEISDIIWYRVFLGKNLFFTPIRQILKFYHCFVSTTCVGTNACRESWRYCVRYKPKISSNTIKNKNKNNCLIIFTRTFDGEICNKKRRIILEGLKYLRNKINTDLTIIFLIIFCSNRSKVILVRAFCNSSVVLTRVSYTKLLITSSE